MEIELLKQMIDCEKLLIRYKVAHERLLQAHPISNNDASLDENRPILFPDKSSVAIMCNVEDGGKMNILIPREFIDPDVVFKMVIDAAAQKVNECIEKFDAFFTETFTVDKYEKAKCLLFLMENVIKESALAFSNRIYHFSSEDVAFRNAGVTIIPNDEVTNYLFKEYQLLMSKQAEYLKGEIEKI
jgi:hypothetical protein